MGWPTQLATLKGPNNGQRSRLHTFFFVLGQTTGKLGNTSREGF